MGREIRMVPKDWKHPKEGGDYKSLLKGPFSISLSEWIEGKEHWDRGEILDYSHYPNRGWKIKTEKESKKGFEEWIGSKPKKSEYMSEWDKEEATYLCMTRSF